MIVAYLTTCWPITFAVNNLTGVLTCDVRLEVIGLDLAA